MTPKAQVDSLVALFSHRNAVAANAIEVNLPTLKSLCEDAAALRELVGMLPKCVGAWLSGSGGHVVFSRDCLRAATWSDDGESSQPWRFCDEHAPAHLKNPMRTDAIEELPTAAVTRRIGL